MAPPQKRSIHRPKISWRGLNLQFLALIFLPLTGILLFITFFSISLHQDAMRSLVGERDERAVFTAAKAIDEELDNRATAVKGLALRAVSQMEYGEILSTSVFLQEDFDFGLAFITSEGEVIDHTQDSTIWEYLPPEFSKVLDKVEALKGKEAVFSPVLFLPEQKELLIFIAYKAADGYPIAVGAFSPTKLAEITLEGPFSDSRGVSVYVISSDRKVLYKNDGFSTSEDPQNHPGISEALRGETGTTYYKIDKIEHVVAYSPIPSTGWALIIEEPWESVTNPTLKSTQLAPLVLVPVLLLALVALWFGARQIIRPLQALETRASDLAWGNYQTIGEPVGGIEEITKLQQALIYLAEKVQLAQKGLHDYIDAITTGQEDERQRLARDLHDVTIQDLIVLNQRIQLMEMNQTDDPETVTVLEEIHTLTLQMIQDLRGLVKALRPVYLEDLGLVAALRMLAMETAKSSGIEIDFHESGSPKRYPPETELALYRIAQEGLNNISRHANASIGTLVIEFSPNEIQLTITDDGRGFEAPESPAEFASLGHFGLLGIYERSELIGAKLDIRSTPSQGTTLHISLPQ